MERARKNGIAFTQPSDITRKLSKKNKDFLVFQNRRLHKSVVINEKKLRELLGELFL